MKIYLAGKIAANDWRHGIVKELRDAMVDKWESPWPVLRGAILGRHDYVGPFFVACDHGCYHGENSHGVGAKSGGCGGKQMHRRQVAENCLSAIDKADFVFAWIESADCFGTLYELGYADAKGKEILAVFSREMGVADYQDLWFTRAAIEGRHVLAGCPKAALESRLFCP